MVQCEHAVEIAAAPEAVFALVADPHRFPEYVPACSDVRAPAGIATAGVEFTVTASHGGRVGEVRYTVVTCEPPTRFVAKFRGPAGGGTMTTTLAATTSGTRVTQVLNHQLAGAFGAFLPPALVARALGKVQQKSLENLKQILEGHSLDAAGTPAAVKEGR